MEGSRRRLRLGSGLDPAERQHIVATFASLDSRLQSFPEGSVELLLTVKERGTPSQRATLEAWIAGTERIVANSTYQDLDAALIEVRDDMVRQITDAKNQTEPRNNRHLRERAGQPGNEPR